jgi:hypothetical protein
MPPQIESKNLPYGFSVFMVRAMLPSTQSRRLKKISNANPKGNRSSFPLTKQTQAAIPTNPENQETASVVNPALMATQVNKNPIGRKMKRLMGRYFS